MTTSVPSKEMEPRSRVGHRWQPLGTVIIHLPATNGKVRTESNIELNLREQLVTDHA